MRERRPSTGRVIGLDAETRRELALIRDAVQTSAVDRATTRANVQEIAQDVKEIKAEAQTTRLMLRSTIIGVVITIVGGIIEFAILRAAFPR